MIPKVLKEISPIEIDAKTTRLEEVSVILKQNGIVCLRNVLDSNNLNKMAKNLKFNSQLLNNIFEKEVNDLPL